MGPRWRPRVLFGTPRVEVDDVDTSTIAVSWAMAYIWVGPSYLDQVHQLLSYLGFVWWGQSQMNNVFVGPLLQSEFGKTRHVDFLFFFRFFYAFSFLEAKQMNWDIFLVATKIRAYT